MRESEPLGGDLGEIMERSVAQGAVPESESLFPTEAPNVATEETDEEDADDA
jgi:hypothetical protein